MVRVIYEKPLTRIDTCPNCKSRVEYEYKDIRYLRTESFFGSIFGIECPRCRKDMQVQK